MRSTWAILAGLVGFAGSAVLVSGCSSSPSSSDGPKDCVSSCEASGGSGLEVCGTDKKTYSGCDWDCGKVPAGVATYPGACQADGSPAADAPPLPADGDIVCDFIRVGSTWQAIECADDLAAALADEGAYLDGNGGGDTLAPESLVGGRLHVLSQTPQEVDHRARYGAVKTQGSASACTAFAMTAALEGSIASSIGEKVPLSDMHLWSRYFTPGIDECSAALQKGGIASAADAEANGFTYDEAKATDWEQKKSAPDAASIGKLDGLSKFEILRVDPIAPPPAKPTAAQIQKSIAEGIDVWIAMYTSDGWGTPNEGVIADYAVSGKGGHAILVVGYKTINGTPHFIFRNSWGPWADGGYGYVSFKTLEDNVLVALAVSVSRKGGGTVPKCADGESADLSGTCRKLCADKTLANEAGECGTPTVTCGEDQTADASGSCVAACKAGDVPGAGFKASCTDRACSWTIDPGSAGCPAGGTACTQTCPAPTCAVLTKKNELGQTIFACAAPNQ